MSELSESSVESFNDESDDNQVVLPSDWTNTECTRLPFVFQNNSGAQFTVDDNNNPMQFFEKFFDEIVFEHIVNETNLFAKQFFDQTQNTNIERVKILVFWEKNLVILSCP